jgi:hypothetical protein
MFTAIKLWAAQAKAKILAFLWLASIAGAIWVTFNLVTGLEAKKKAAAYEDAIKENNKLTLELRHYREKTSKALEKAQGEILYLEGVRLSNETNNKECDTTSALVQYIKLRRDIQKKLANL